MRLSDFNLIGVDAIVAIVTVYVLLAVVIWQDMIRSKLRREIQKLSRELENRTE